MLNIKGIVVALIGFWLLTPTVLANKSSVEIQAPEAVSPGTEVTVTIKVSHKGNSFFHYTDRLVVFVDGEELKKYAFTAGNRPENEEFERTITLVIEKETRIEAEANCNLHGSEGKVSVVIKTK